MVEIEYIKSIGFKPYSVDGSKVMYYNENVTITHCQKNNTYAIEIVGVRRGTFNTCIMGDFKSIFILKSMDYNEFKLMKRSRTIKKILK